MSSEPVVDDDKSVLIREEEHTIYSARLRCARAPAGWMRRPLIRVRLLAILTFVAGALVALQIISAAHQITPPGNGNNDRSRAPARRSTQWLAQTALLFRFFAGSYLWPVATPAARGAADEATVVYVCNTGVNVQQHFAHTHTHAPTRSPQ
jgi:hypothetical protein